MSIHPQLSMQLTGANASVALRPAACGRFGMAKLSPVISGGYLQSEAFVGGLPFVGGLLGGWRVSSCASDCTEEGPS